MAVQGLWVHLVGSKEVVVEEEEVVEYYKET